MPKLTDASRLARRDAIAEATLRVLHRRGVAHTAIADIVEELGGSAGGVYSHFTSKAEIVRYIARSVYSMRSDAFTRLAAIAAPPAAILRAALTGIETDVPVQVIVQLWGEATVDPEMRAVVLETLAEVEEALKRSVLPWASTQAGDPDALAASVARAMRAVSQGYITQLALFDAPNPDEYVEGIAALFGEAERPEGSG